MRHERAVVVCGEGETRERLRGALEEEGCRSIVFAGSMADAAEILRRRNVDLLLVSHEIAKAMADDDFQALTRHEPPVETLVVAPTAPGVAAGEDLVLHSPPTHLQHAVRLALARRRLRAHESDQRLRRLLTALVQHLCEPCNDIRETAEHCLAADEVTPQVSDSLTGILRGVETVYEYVHRLMEYADPPNDAFEAATPADVMDDACLAVRGPCVAARVTVKSTVSRDLPHLFIQRAVLVKACVEIMQNAVEAMPNGGTMHVSATYLRECEEVEFRLSDSGPGIRALHASMIFEPFFSAWDGHVGLGLSIARHAIERQGGSVSLAQGAGEGATFVIRIPVMPETTA